MNKIVTPQLIDLTHFKDQRGELGVIEQSSLPFDIQRVYYIFGVPIGAVRGEHAHKQLQQLMICMNGTCEISFSDGTQWFDFTLDRPSVGILVPPGMWRKIRFVTPDSVLCVMASRPYEPEDYIHSYEEFLVWSENNKVDS